MNRLVISRDFFWDEIGAARISVLAREGFRGALSAFTRQTEAPRITLEEFSLVRREVPLVDLDGELLTPIREKGRLKLVSHRKSSEV